MARLLEGVPEGKNRSKNQVLQIGFLDKTKERAPHLEYNFKFLSLCCSFTFGLQGHLITVLSFYFWDLGLFSPPKKI